VSWQDSNTVPTYLEGLGLNADETEKKTTTWERTQKPGKIHSDAAHHCDRLSFFQPHHQVRTHMGKKTMRALKRTCAFPQAQARTPYRLPPAIGSSFILLQIVFGSRIRFFSRPLQEREFATLIQSRVRSSSLG
jgi:hypothetical protein